MLGGCFPVTRTHRSTSRGCCWCRSSIQAEMQKAADSQGISVRDLAVFRDRCRQELEERLEELVKAWDCVGVAALKADLQKEPEVRVASVSVVAVARGRFRSERESRQGAMAWRRGSRSRDADRGGAGGG